MDILEFLKKYGIEIPEDKQSDFNNDFKQNCKLSSEHYKGKLIELQRKYAADIEDRDKIIGDQIKQIGELNFDSKLSTALNGIEFSNSRVRNSIISEIKNKNFKVSDSGEIEGLQDYLKGLYDSEPDSFKAVDSGVHTWYGGSSGRSGMQEKIDNASDLFGRIL